ncbi:MAG: hypothetical protein IJD16_02545 [Desulfovibrio sp.]|nr:hypothetical protein [Desulfovibrio sp.]
MSEVYTLRIKGTGLEFEERQDAFMEKWMEEPSTMPEGYFLETGLGHDDLLTCNVWHRQEGAGGCFFLFDADGDPLLAAVAESNLAYAMGMAYFAKMTAEVRYAADIYESLDPADA